MGMTPARSARKQHTRRILCVGAQSATSSQPLVAGRAPFFAPLVGFSSSDVWRSRGTRRTSQGTRVDAARSRAALVMGSSCTQGEAYARERPVASWIGASAPGTG
jgi:hypothetical protein